MDTGWLRWSPDSTRISYSNGDGIYVLTVATGSTKKVAEGGGNTEWVDDHTLVVGNPLVVGNQGMAERLAASSRQGRREETTIRDMREAHEMATHQTLAGLGELEPQHGERQRRSTRQKAGSYRLVAALMILAGTLVACSSAGDDTQSGATGSSETPDPSLHLFTTGDPNFDSSYRITTHLLDGYTGEQGGVVFGTDDGQGMSAWTVKNVYAEPCKWAGTLLDPPIDPSVDGLVAGLTSQKDRHATAATDVSLSGFTGKYMEMTTPAGIDLADCDGGEFRTWIDAWKDRGTSRPISATCCGSSTSAAPAW